MAGEVSPCGDRGEVDFTTTTITAIAPNPITLVSAMASSDLNYLGRAVQVPETYRTRVGVPTAGGPWALWSKSFSESASRWPTSYPGIPSSTPQMGSEPVLRPLERRSGSRTSAPGGQPIVRQIEAHELHTVRDVSRRPFHGPGQFCREHPRDVALFSARTRAVTRTRRNPR